MALRVRDMPPGVRFCLTRNGHKFTMIRQHEDLHYLYRVIAHPWQDKKMSLSEREATLNGQSYVKPVVRLRP